MQEYENELKQHRVEQEWAKHKKEAGITIENLESKLSAMAMQQDKELKKFDLEYEAVLQDAIIDAQAAMEKQEEQLLQQRNDDVILQCTDTSEEQCKIIRQEAQQTYKDLKEALDSQKKERIANIEQSYRAKKKKKMQEAIEAHQARRQHLEKLANIVEDGVQLFESQRHHLEEALENIRIEEAQGEHEIEEKVKKQHHEQSERDAQHYKLLTRKLQEQRDMDQETVEHILGEYQHHTEMHQQQMAQDMATMKLSLKKRMQERRVALKHSLCEEYTQQLDRQLAAEQV